MNVITTTTVLGSLMLILGTNFSPALAQSTCTIEPTRPEQGPVLVPGEAYSFGDLQLRVRGVKVVGDKPVFNLDAKFPGGTEKLRVTYDWKDFAACGRQVSLAYIKVVTTDTMPVQPPKKTTEYRLEVSVQ